MKVRERWLASGRVTFRVDYSMQGKRVQRTIPGHDVEPLPEETPKAFEARVRKAFKNAREDAGLLYHEQKRRIALGELAGPSLRERTLTVEDALKEFAGRDGLSPQTRLHYQDKTKLIVGFFGKDRRTHHRQAPQRSHQHRAHDVPSLDAAMAGCGSAMSFAFGGDLVCACSRWCPPGHPE